MSPSLTDLASQALAMAVTTKAVVTCAMLASCSFAAIGAYTDAKPLSFKGNFDPFKVLDLPRSQSLPASDVLKKAFKKAALKWHPDRCKRTNPIEECESRMEEVKLAQDVLSDDRRLQQWEAWDEDRRSGGPRKDSERRKPQGQPRRPGQQPGGGAGFFEGFPNANFGGGPSFNFGSGAGPSSGRRPGEAGGKRRPPRPGPAPRPRPPPSPSPTEEKRWRVVSTETTEGPAGAKIELVTRERPLPNTAMIQVEVLEKTCYRAQVQCQEKVLERRRRRREDHEKGEL